MRCPDADERPESERGVELSVIAPCLNEQENIDPLVDRTLAALASLNVPAEFVLVDDGSTDDTWRAICRRRQRDSRAIGVRHAVNRGMVPAWRSGLEAASGRLVCLIDADLQNRPEDIPRLYDALRMKPCDVVQAVRHPEKGVRRNHLFSRALNHLLNLTFRMRSRDNKSGFILCRREVLARCLDHRYRYRLFQNLLGAAISARGYTIVEVDTVFEQRRGGKSFLSAFPLLFSARVFWELIKFRVETLQLDPCSAPAAEGMQQNSHTLVESAPSVP